MAALALPQRTDATHGNHNAAGQPCHCISLHMYVRCKQSKESCTCSAANALTAQPAGTLPNSTVTPRVAGPPFARLLLLLLPAMDGSTSAGRESAPTPMMPLQAQPTMGMSCKRRCSRKQQQQGQLCVEGSTDHVDTSAALAGKMQGMLQAAFHCNELEHE